MDLIAARSVVERANAVATRERLHRRREVFEIEGPSQR
jgi:hypothetical protein